MNFVPLLTMNFSSKLIENAVNAFATLPGVGKKTALRLVLHLLKQNEGQVEAFGEAIVKMKKEIKFCGICHNISDADVCSICANPVRDQETICVVESLRDVMAIENTGHFTGVYHLLGGLISPIEGVSPDDLNIDSLVGRVEKSGIKEVIMAISPTIEGDTTIFYLNKKLEPFDVKTSTLARGISFGGELEYADELTLARSITARIPFPKSNNP